MRMRRTPVTFRSSVTLRPPVRYVCALAAIASLGVAAGCKSRQYNNASAKSTSALKLSPETFRGVLIQTKPMLITASYQYANDSFQWLLERPDFKDFVPSEWVMRPYGTSRYDFVAQPRGSIADAYKGSDFEMDIEALKLGFEANFRYAPGSMTLEDGRTIKGKALTKIAILLKDGKDHSEANYVTGKLPWDPSKTLSTEDELWAHKFIRVPEAWELLAKENKRPGEGVTIGILDTGILPHTTVWGAGAKTPEKFMPEAFDMSRAATFAPTEANLAEKFSQLLKEPWKPEAWSATPPLSMNTVKAADPFTFNALPANPGHGTSVATLLVGKGSEFPTNTENPKSYVKGIVPHSKLIPVRITPSTVYLEGVYMARGFDHLAAQGANVITVSLGGVPDINLHESIIKAYKQGIIITAAVGNGFPFVVWPAAYKEVIAVGAGSVTCEQWGKSSPGSKVEILAPGDQVWYGASFFDRRWYNLKGGPTNDSMIYTVKRGQGTSFATPHVAAVASLWLSKHGVQNIIKLYRDQRAEDDRYVSLAFRYLLAQPSGHTQCPGGDASRNSRNAGGAFLNAEAILKTELAQFPTKAQLDVFEMNGLREQESYDLAFTAVATIAAGVPELFTEGHLSDDEVGILPIEVRKQLIAIFRAKIKAASGGR